MRALKTLLILDGKIVEERLVEQGESVRVEDVVVIEAVDGRYRLRFTESMTGKLATADFRGSLAKLRQRTTTDRVAGVYYVPLTEDAKGSVDLEDGASVWFRFEEPPPPIDDEFRPTLIDGDDPVFLGWLGTWSAAATVLLAFVWSAAPPEVVLEELPAQYTRVYVPEEPAPVEPDEPLERQEPEVATRAEKTTEQGERKHESKLDRARHRDRARKDVVKKSALLNGLGVKGKDKGAARLWDGAPGIGEVDAALRGAKEVFLDSGPQLRTGPEDQGPEVLDDDDLGPIDDGPVVIDDGPEVEPVPTIELEDGTVEEGTSDALDARQVVKDNYGQLRFCYERELRGQNDLEGRVEVGWSVQSGSVASVWVVANDTGSTALADCLVQRIERWSFGRGVDGEMSWPFVFRTE